MEEPATEAVRRAKPVAPRCLAVRPCSLVLPSVKGAVGWAGGNMCPGHGACGNYSMAPCPALRTPEPGTHVISAYGLDYLSPVRLGALHDFLPDVNRSEIGILHSWMSHFSARRVPWLVVCRNGVYSLWIRRVA